MENIRYYILNQYNRTIQYNKIYDEYIYLEILCLNTIFHDNEKMDEVMHILKNRENNLKVNLYYKNKVEYLLCYFNNFNKFSNFNNKINEYVIDR